MFIESALKIQCRMLSNIPDTVLEFKTFFNNKKTFQSKLTRSSSLTKIISKKLFIPLRLKGWCDVKQRRYKL